MSPLEQHRFGTPQVKEIPKLPVVERQNGEVSIQDAGVLHEFGGQVLHMAEYAERRQKQLEAEQERHAVFH
jgi:hypothetical protein